MTSNLDLDDKRVIVPAMVGHADPRSKSSRIHAAGRAEPDWRFAWLWSAYRALDPSDEGDGRGVGDLQTTLGAIRRWIVDGMRWQDVPEFADSGSRR